MATAGTKIISRTCKLCNFLIVRRCLTTKTHIPRLKSNAKLKGPFYNISLLTGFNIKTTKAIFIGTTFGTGCYLLRNGILFAYSQDDGRGSDNSEYRFGDFN
jgi:hypothetical protein